MKHLLLAVLMGAATLLSGAELRKIRCSTYPVWLLTRQIAQGSGASVELVIPPGTGCPHDYALTPRDMEKLSERDQLLVINGLGMDDFLLHALYKVNPGAPVINSTASAPAGAADATNPHWFASPDMARKMAENIASGLTERDRKNAPLYQENLKKLDADLAQLEARFAALRPVPGDSAPTVVIQHGIFAYLAQLAGFRVILLLESDDESALTPVRLRQLVRQVHTEKPVAIWADKYAPQGAVETLARECKLPVVMLDMLAGGPDAPPDGYFCRVMEQDLKLISESAGAEK